MYRRYGPYNVVVVVENRRVRRRHRAVRGKYRHSRTISTIRAAENVRRIRSIVIHDTAETYTA